MTTTVSTALAALQLRPDDAQALQLLKAVHPGNGAGIEADALSKALADARRWTASTPTSISVSSSSISSWGSPPVTPAGPSPLHEKGRLLSDELLRDEAGQAAVQQALEAVPNHKPSAESLAQMTLVRANWEPISRRYLQQAEQAKDPALASSLHGSVAEFYLKYRPTGPEGETHLRKSLELDAGNRRSAAHLERICARRVGATSCWRSIASAPSGPRPARSVPPPRSWPASCASSWGAAPTRSCTSARRSTSIRTSHARCRPSAPR